MIYLGDEVFACSGGIKGGQGALAEYTLVDARLLAEIGDSKALASQIREVTQDTHELGALCERVRSYALQELTASAWVGRIHKALEL